MTKEKLYVGLDIGSNSVGIACTDENYNIVRAKGKDCWAVRLFDESESAANRRVARTARRRLTRRKFRINQLQNLFAPYMQDDLFFLRLNNSQFYAEDKDSRLKGSKNNLFDDDTLCDSAFHKQFPTIFHLREFLQHNHADDLRLYYLAIHHIVKYRGHFLFEGSMSDVRDFGRLISALNAVCEELYPEAPYFNVALNDQAKEILLQSNVGTKQRCKNLQVIWGSNAQKDSAQVQNEIVKAMCGAKVSPSTLFGGEYPEEKTFSFKDLTDEEFESKRAVYGDNFSLLEAIRNVVNFVQFENLLDEKDSFSQAMIAVYNKHATDLALLKSLLREKTDSQTYNRMFKSTKEGHNYVNYVGYTNKGGEKKRVKVCNYEDFRDYAKKFLKGINVQDERVEEITAQLEQKTFLPKILHSDNGLVPYQVNETELNAIVRSMVEAFPQTEEIATKIKQIFLFRIPYYVGPLTGSNSWAVRKVNGVAITPWNFDEIIDKPASNEQFMRRMTNKCSYLTGEDVLPKGSVIYQCYNVLNQLNKLKINDVAITVRLKQKIFNELFLRRNKVSDKMIIDLLIREGMFAETDRSQINLSGKDGAFTATMSSYIQLQKILGKDFVDDDYANGNGVCENIILWHTLNTDKNVVEGLIRQNYGKIPQIKQNIAQLKGLTFKDFGRLSAKFLTDLYTTDKQTGEVFNIMRLLQDTTYNLNEILFNEQYDFERLLSEQNNGAEEITLDDVEKLYVSPAVRRGIWQSLQMVDEYISALGRLPDKIFVEVTREEGVKGDAGRTQSRKKQLLEKYRGIEGIEQLTQELQSDDVTDMKLRQERLYLYFRQLGKCMYTGEQIDLSALNTDTYDVDHILPRSLFKDDSLDNKVLVLRSKNFEKLSIYPLPQGFTNQQEFWKKLHKKELISQKTLDRLMRTDPLTDADYNDFEARQKVITDQTAKAVIELLKRKYPTVKLVYSKAKDVSDFRHKFNLYKCRETNDFHHARDAYLNVVVGNVCDTAQIIRKSQYRTLEEGWRAHNNLTLFTRTISGAWDKVNSLKTVLHVMGRLTMSVTRYAYCNKGKFYDETVYSGNENVTAPRKLTGPLANMKRYGGYMSQKTAYFAIVQSVGKKGKICKTIEAIPVLVTYQMRNNPNRLVEYLQKDLGLNQPQIIVPKLKIKQLVTINGTPVWLAGITNKRIRIHNAIELFIDNKTDDYIKQLDKLVNYNKNGLYNVNDQTDIPIKTNRLGKHNCTITTARNIELYDMLTDKLSLPIYQGISGFSAFKKNLQNGRSKFVQLTNIGQATVLLQALKVFKCNAESADLSLLDMGKNCGILLTNKDITNVDFEIVHQSPCGLTVRKKKV